MTRLDWSWEHSTFLWSSLLFKPFCQYFMGLWGHEQITVAFLIFPSRMPILSSAFWSALASPVESRQSRLASRTSATSSATSEADSKPCERCRSSFFIAAASHHGHNTRSNACSASLATSMAGLVHGGAGVKRGVVGWVCLAGHGSSGGAL